MPKAKTEKENASKAFRDMFHTDPEVAVIASLHVCAAVEPCLRVDIFRDKLAIEKDLPLVIERELVFERKLCLGDYIETLLQNVRLFGYELTEAMKEYDIYSNFIIFPKEETMSKDKVTLVAQVYAEKEKP